MRVYVFLFIHIFTQTFQFNWTQLEASQKALIYIFILSILTTCMLYLNVLKILQQYFLIVQSLALHKADAKCEFLKNIIFFVHSETRYEFGNVVGKSALCFRSSVVFDVRLCSVRPFLLLTFIM